jgi:hypothetical protein
MYTRSQNKSATKRTAPAIRYSKDNHRWTQSEEREMVRLRRLENLNFQEIATELHRSPEAIKLRFEKLLMEHTEGESDVSETLRWFNLTDE